MATKTFTKAGGDFKKKAGMRDAFGRSFFTRDVRVSLEFSKKHDSKFERSSHTVVLGWWRLK